MDSGLLVHRNYKLASTIQDPNVEKRIKAISDRWYSFAIILVAAGLLAAIFLASFIGRLMKCNIFQSF